MIQRINWIDQVKGFGIFLVVYGHNFPFLEKYIYSFHMPLFFLLAGVFHKANFDKKNLINKTKQLIVPYFLWSILLFLFWVLIGRKFGDSLEKNYSVWKNLWGVFFAQGGPEYMDWGIPLWFLPTLFLSFLMLSMILKIRNVFLGKIILVLSILLGFLIPYLFSFKFFWSLDVALVSLFFYALGYYSKNFILKQKKSKYVLLFLIIGSLHFLLFTFNLKIDMYRSEYGNQFLFLLNGVLGCLFYLSLFVLLPFFKFLEYLGKFTLVILALQLRAMTVIKLVLVLVFGMHVFYFSETEKFVFSVFQIILILPVTVLINKYIPVLNGGQKND